jgi:hypothetical protein
MLNPCENAGEIELLSSQIAYSFQFCITLRSCDIAAFCYLPLAQAFEL